MVTLRRLAFAAVLILLLLATGVFAYSNPEPIDIDVGLTRFEQVPMAVAFGSGAKLPKIVTAPLLFFFPLWAAYPRVIAGLILLLLAAFAVAMERRSAVAGVPAAGPA